ncbi:glycogen debranching protein GlgX [Falsiroseomonas tokyonensis]|uniref:4-alpha-glucanotransferase n=1 Tax=Falsiroseomonas tokyonensis TaxID=430521 RepID=A0ABV7BTT9_9PROT|nr:glycogen debranching protein GlgX [Falsiroseomonas tokyonensis]MBU8537498.1 glycogen debranching protein GlgX [Falsiroseomonas tokyonensis]
MQAEASPGQAEPLGATLDANGANFAFPAPDATAVFLCVFDAQDREVARIRLPGRSGDVHHGHVAGLAAGTRYGLRVAGPWQPQRGHRFNPQKLLVDPWATALDRPFALHPALFDTGEMPEETDSAPHLPKAILTPPLPPLIRTAPTGPQVIYELHVKGFSQRNPAVPERLRGTFAGLGHPASVAHLKRLGVTVVELLPAAAWIDERHLPPLGLSNYWGYNPVALLAPDPRLAPGGMAEVRAAVAALQAAGIAVIQDVVFNHTGECDELGPTLSLKGLGNAAFHRLLPEDARRYANDAGTGNTLALDRPWPLRLAMDAFRHWAEQAGLDGFRLDLATTLARRDAGFDPDAPLIQAMRQDPVLRKLRIIAEPWDIGRDGYQLGRFPPGWGEWNDRFRDDIRRFWRGDAGGVGALATRLAGSADVFAGRPLTDSVNYITAHDGFTLADLVSHSEKRNEANGEQNRDGTGDNLSWNCGVEGRSDDAEVKARRLRDSRALLATLLLARGTPMLSMGDEAGRSQGGNNNAYAQDNALSWFNWPAMDQGLCDFAARLITARRAHPALQDAAPLTGVVQADGLPDVAWLRPDGAALQDDDWQDRDRRALVAVLAKAGDRCLLALNAGADPLPLTLPPPRPGQAWKLLVDSSDPAATALPATLPARAVLLLAEAPRAAVATDDSALLARLAQAAGIDTSWYPISGPEVVVPPTTLRALLGALGLPAENAAAIRDSLNGLSTLPALPASVTHRGATPARLALPLSDRPRMLLLTAEDGHTQRIPVPPEAGETQRLVLPDGRAAAQRLVSLPLLPPGRHVLRDEAAPERACLLTVSPARCHLPGDLDAGGRRFGLSAQIYGLRGARDQGIGDFSAVGEFAALAQQQGAAVVGISPPHALFPTDRTRASPYHPSDRRFLDPIFIDVTALPGVGELPEMAQAAPIFAALATGESVDYAAVWTAKRAVLLAAWRRLKAEPAGLTAFRRDGGEALEHFCTFVAIADRIGHSDARAWPVGLRHGADAGLAAFRAEHADSIGFAAFQQWIADSQLAAAGRAGAGLYRDLAVGAAPDGAEIWSGDSRFLPGFSVGAPPDPFALEGQVWGLPPPDPRHGEALGHAPFARLIRANMRHAAALRVDHVLGLKRLFLVPEGARGSEGTYLAQPFADLLGQLALESTRANCLVVGEDLGTVPEGIGHALQSANILSYRVLWFERHGSRFTPPETWPARAAACVSTHDLATLQGFWDGADIAERAALGLLPDVAAAEAERAADRAALLQALAEPNLLPEGATPDGAMDDALAAAIHALVALTPSALLLVQAEDLAGERQAVNLPGTDRERPNWRRRLPVPVAELAKLPRAGTILEALRRLRP